MGASTDTEKEAKMKWCPQARYFVAPDGNGYSNMGPGAKDSTCIASECMAWRWTEGYTSVNGKAKALGYCGLAGKP